MQYEPWLCGVIIMKQIEKFELGKKYFHSDANTTMKIVGMAETVIHGIAFIGEDKDGNLSPVQTDFVKFPEATIGWQEVNAT